MAFGEMMSSTVGVANGDGFRYNYTYYFNSNDLHAFPPTSFSWINQTSYFMINVTGVSGSSVNFNTMLLSINGSSHLGVCSMDVGTGAASISGYGGPIEASNFYFMARNVGMMGRMFPSSSMSPTINGTVMMSYTSVSRMATHLTTTTNQNGETINSDYYYDQATGMMVEWRQEMLQTSGTLQTNSTQLMKMTSSSVWVIPEFPFSIDITIFIIAVSAVVVLRVAKFKRSVTLTDL